MAERPGPRFPDFLKAAFGYHWNLLAVGAGAVFAFLSGYPDIVLPLLAAGEITYLMALGMHPRFQRAIAAEKAKLRQASAVDDSQEKLKQITSSLTPADLKHFDALKWRCVRLNRIARGIKDSAEPGTEIFDDYRAGGIDRLLWTFLKLLYGKTLLQQFIESTDRDAMHENAREVEQRIGALGEAAADDPGRQKIRRSLEDNLDTLKQRIANYDQAAQNLEFVKLEIERIENKINSISEIAVNRQDPDYITAQVDSVAKSMVATEKTMSELKLFASTEQMDEQPPAFLRRQVQ